MGSQPGLLAEAAAAFHGRAGTIVAAAALALVPASLIAASVVDAARRHGQAELGTTPAEQRASRDRSLERMPPAEGRRDALRDAGQSDAERARAVPSAIFVASFFLAAFFVSLGVLLAQAAVLPLAFAERGGEIAIATCWGALWKTAVLASAMVALGLLFCVLPGIFFAVSFSLAMPAVVAERLGGFAALSRSARLVRRGWPELLATIFFPAGAVVVVYEAMRRLLGIHGLLPLAALQAIVTAIVLPFPLVLSHFVYLRVRSEVDGTPLAELRQYMRRISAPG
jgi:hypothetical protein